MIFTLIAASLTAQPMVMHKVRPSGGIAPCQAVPALCIATREESEGPRLEPNDSMARSSKMDAYRFDARPCRQIGNMGCTKRARSEIIRLGEPIRDTLARSFKLN
jgi:hypothetical protein